MIEIELKQPVTAYGENVTVLKFKNPTGKDLRMCGIPLRPIHLSDGDSVDINSGVVAQFISVLCTVPLSTVDSLCPEDWIAAMKVVLGFFQGSAP